MSRIGNAIITIPEGVEVSFADGLVTVKGKKGELVQAIDDAIKMNIEDGVITFTRNSDIKMLMRIEHQSHTLFWLGLTVRMRSDM